MFTMPLGDERGAGAGKIILFSVILLQAQEPNFRFQLVLLIYKAEKYRENRFRSLLS